MNLISELDDVLYDKKIEFTKEIDKLIEIFQNNIENEIEVVLCSNEIENLNYLSLDLLGNKFDKYLNDKEVNFFELIQNELPSLRDLLIKLEKNDYAIGNVEDGENVVNKNTFSSNIKPINVVKKNPDIEKLLNVIDENENSLEISENCSSIARDKHLGIKQLSSELANYIIENMLVKIDFISVMDIEIRPTIQFVELVNNDLYKELNLNSIEISELFQMTDSYLAEYKNKLRTRIEYKNPFR